MKFWNWSPVTIWHNMRYEINKFSKITPPYSVQHTVVCYFAYAQRSKWWTIHNRFYHTVQLKVNWIGVGNSFFIKSQYTSVMMPYSTVPWRVMLLFIFQTWSILNYIHLTQLKSLEIKFKPFTVRYTLPVVFYTILRKENTCNTVNIIFLPCLFVGKLINQHIYKKQKTIYLHAIFLQGDRDQELHSIA